LRCIYDNAYIGTCIKRQTFNNFFFWFILKIQKMKNKLFILAIILLSINSYSQIVFEEGYYINN
jgi:hypothetical protein